MPKTPVLAKSPSGFETSSYAQETLCYLWQQLVFEEASEMLKIMKCIDVNSKQIEWVRHHYGGVLEGEIQHAIKQGESKEYNLQDKDHTHYVMTDGAMFLTREEGWKEVKMARIFKTMIMFKHVKTKRLLQNQSMLLIWATIGRYSQNLNIR